MANTRYNVLRVSGHGADIEALRESAKADGANLDLDRVVPRPEGMDAKAAEDWERANWGTPELAPGDADEPVALFDERGLRVAEFTFYTKGHAPFPLARPLVAANPDRVASMITIDLANEVAEIRVYGANDEWSYEAPSEEIQACLDQGLAEEGSVIDMLYATAGSVIDDYEQAAQISVPKP